MQGQSVATPKTLSELDALQALRNELTAQINGVSARRERLVSERFTASSTNNPAMVAEHDAQIKALGARLASLEARKLAVDDAIAEGLPKVIVSDPGRQAADAQQMAETEAQTTIARIMSQGARDEERIRSEYERMMLMEGIGIVLVSALLWRYALNRALRKHRVAAGESDPALRQAVDAIAIEVERISENQRYMTKLLTEQNPAGIESSASREPEAVRREPR